MDVFVDFENVTKVILTSSSESDVTTDGVSILLTEPAQQPDVASAMAWWLILLLFLIVLLIILVLLIACFVWMNRGGKYPG